MIESEESVVRWFPADYEAEVIGTLPPGVAALSFYYGDARVSSAGMLVKVQPALGAAWHGEFFSWNVNGARRAYHTPDPNRLCVNFCEGAWCVDVRNPHHYEVVPVCPVLEIRHCSNERLLLLSSFTEIAAIGDGGVLWESERLASDGLRSIQCAQGRIIGEGWSLSDDWIPFELEASTGRRLR